MNIQYCSDLHLEQPENAKWLKAHPLKPVGDVLILAGDIVPFVEMDQYEYFFDYCSSQFKTTYWLPGNHEYFGGDITNRSGSFREYIRPNVILLNNVVEQLEGGTLIFSTLWSHISPAAEWEVARAVTDYRSITYQGESFRPLHSNRLHKECGKFIEKAVAEATDSCIVVTHHVPTFIHYPKQFKGSPVNEAFATELFEFIESSPMMAWIYGHHHQNTPEFTIGHTRLLTNQLGYVRKREYYGFRGDAVVNL